MANKKDLANGAAEATSKFFASSGAAQPKKSEELKETPIKEEKVKTAKQVFSFRGEKDKVKAWRLYATVTGTKVDDLGSLAMQEYIDKHPLKGAEKALFDERMNS